MLLAGKDSCCSSNYQESLGQPPTPTSSPWEPVGGAAQPKSRLRRAEGRSWLAGARGRLRKWTAALEA